MDEYNPVPMPTNVYQEIFQLQIGKLDLDPVWPYTVEPWNKICLIHIKSV